VLFPSAYWLWLKTFGGDHRRVVLSIFLPVVFAYVTPWLGIKVLRIWRFNMKSEMRWQHGFVLGSGANLAAWLCYFPSRPDMLVYDSLRYAVIFGSTFALWSWIYDIYAIKSGFIIHYTKEAYEKKSEEEMTFAYAPLVFGTFAFCVGISFKFFEHWRNSSPVLDAAAWIVAALFCSFTPWGVWIAQHYMRKGDLGLRSYEKLMVET